MLTLARPITHAEREAHLISLLERERMDLEEAALLQQRDRALQTNKRTPAGSAKRTAVAGCSKSGASKSLSVAGCVRCGYLPLRLGHLHPREIREAATAAYSLGCKPPRGGTGSG